ncbi:MAG: aminotransferase class III-fold pyridoxal phosphate-dependent enzyme, partial [Candidatus Hodarchaeales archaeon]
MSSILDRARNSIAQGALTNSKRPESHLIGLYPTHIKSAQKAHIWDLEDVRYLDYMGGLGCNLFGYGNDQVNQEVLKYLWHGGSHSLPTYHEVEAAEAVKEMIPFIDRVKFLKTGSEACSAAIRIARAATGRPIVLSKGYHGWSDEFVSLTNPATGVSNCPDIFELGDGDSLFDPSDIACIIVEPVCTDDSEANVEWLKALRQRCDETGALLIFDEVITGLRYKNYAVCNNYGVLPDLVILGKALGNGFPIACVGGKAEVMDSDYFVSSTYAGEIFSLVAAKKCIELVMHDYRYDLEWLWEQGKSFMETFNNNPSTVRIEGYPTRGK